MKSTQQQCTICKKNKAELCFPFNPNKFCKNCFTVYFEKKILRNIREHKLLKNQKITIYENNNLKNKVIKSILTEKFSKSGKITIQSQQNTNPKTQEYTLETVEETASKFLQEFINNSKIYYPEKNLLENCSIEEIKAYASIKNISGNISINEKYFKNLKEIYKKDPSIFFSTAKSAKKLKQTLNHKTDTKLKSKSFSTRG